MCMLARRGLDRKRMCGMGPRALEHLRARILRRSLGSVFMLPAMWCDSEVRALATEAVLIELESPLCNVVDGCGSIVGKRCKVKGRRKRPSSWLRRSKPPFTSIWSHQSVLRLCYTGVRSVLGIEVPWELLIWRCLSSTCTRCKSVKRLPKKVCWVPSTCLTGRESWPLDHVFVWSSSIPVQPSLVPRFFGKILVFCCGSH